jgi:hypothetical protein
MIEGSGSVLWLMDPDPGGTKKYPVEPDPQHCFKGCFYICRRMEQSEGRGAMGRPVEESVSGGTAERPAAGRRVSRHSCPAHGATSRSAVLSPATWSEQSSARAAPPSATSHRSPGLASTFIGKENMYCSAAASSQVLDPEFLFWSRQACLVHILSTLESIVPVPDP